MTEYILVCDPSAQVRRALELILRGAGHKVLTAESGGEALQRAAERAPQAVVLELQLPDIAGVEVCRRLREQDEMPILVLSEIDDEGVKIEAFEHGADDYVTKPFNAGELVARLAAALRRAWVRPRVEADGLVIDLQDQLVMLDGRDVHLTPTEFSLLRVLVTSRGPVAHEALAAKVWGPLESDAGPRLRTHIARLRVKLGGGARNDVIRTEVGVGYRFAGLA